ncbi:hypothetical protein O6H91_02G024900 [Diphasiastrum complanatum]|nr:hypothetical protein O6H91_02G024900 [Diphasiastrum complanatum]
MLQRLNFEMHQRKDLCKQRDLLEARKKILQENIANRRKFLSSLPSQLKSLKKASLPVQQHLGIQHTKRMKQHHLAELLPPPLYILYSQLLSYKEAFGESVDLEILGSAKDAQAVIRQQANKEAGALPSDEVKIDNEEVEEDDDSQRRRKRTKKDHEKESSDAMGVYHTHPLSVILHVYDDEKIEGEKPPKLLALRFEYMQMLNVISVVLDGSLDQNGLLDNLFPDDTGLDLPNQAAKFFAAGEVYSGGKHQPRWYKWAQHLAGLDFLPETPPLMQDPKKPSANEHLQISSGLSIYRQQHRVQIVLKQLRARKKAQLALKEQLAFLTKLERPPLRFTNVPWALNNPKNALHSWIEVECSSQQSPSLLEREAQLVGSAETSSDITASAAGISENEGGREDGELPSAPVVSRVIVETSLNVEPVAITTPSKEADDLALAEGPTATSKHFHSTLEKASTKVQKSKSIKVAYGRDNVVHTGSGNVMVVTSLGPDIDSLGGETIDSMDIEEPTEGTTEDTELPRIQQSWKDHAVREFSAVFRRDVTGWKVFELEAQIQLSLEYPRRCPAFQLRMLSDVESRPMPAAPPGVLDVVETSVTVLEPVRWFNQLRTIESKVNLSVLAKLPKSEENYVLAHQIALLSMLFDLEVDYELAYQSVPHMNSTLLNMGLSDVLDGKLGPRSFRGRDRRKLLDLNQ